MLQAWESLEQADEKSVEVRYVGFHQLLENGGMYMLHEKVYCMPSIIFVLNGPFKNYTWPVLQAAGQWCILKTQRPYYMGSGYAKFSMDQFC